MRLDELFTNLGVIAGTVAAQMREAAVPGVPADELDLTGPPPRKVALTGPAHVAIAEGDVFRVEVESGPGSEDVRFTLDEKRLTIAGGEPETVVRVTLASVRKLALAGSGRMSVARLAQDGKVSIAGSGRVELERVDGGVLDVNISGSGRLMANGEAEMLELSIAGSGSFDGEGLSVDRAKVSVAGSGDAIFGCDGEVSASLMGSGNVIVRGSARCRVSSVGSGTLVCERPRDAA